MHLILQDIKMMDWMVREGDGTCLGKEEGREKDEKGEEGSQLTTRLTTQSNTSTKPAQAQTLNGQPSKA